VSWPSKVASERLDDVTGVRLDETSHRQVHRGVRAIGRRRDETPPSVLAKAVADGDQVEFLTDGVLVPPRCGWR
jgi:hypothetical protein